jgi:hypothetical protein
MASFGNAPAETARDNDKVVPGPGYDSPGS